MSSVNNNAVGSLHLLRNIPAEIRNQIWREVVQGGKSSSLLPPVKKLILTTQLQTAASST